MPSRITDSRGVFLEKNSPVMDARSMPPAGIESKHQRGVWFAELVSDIVVYGSFVCSAHSIPLSERGRQSQFFGLQGDGHSWRDFIPDGIQRFAGLGIKRRRKLVI